jgi:tetratricopeptide (TPR) repeat protein
MPPRSRPPGGKGKRGGAPRKPRTDEAPPKRPGWGSVARKGAGRLRDDRPSGASKAFREAAGADGEREPWEPERWIDEGETDEIRRTAGGAVGRSRGQEQRQGRTERPPRKRPDKRGSAAKDGARDRAVDDDVTRAVGPSRAAKVGQRLSEAARAFDRQRYADARKLLKPLADQAPSSATVRELHGLSLYRLGRWREAARELEAFRSLTGGVEQHPVLADCYRALGRHEKVIELWDELREASPGAELVAEGRIVLAGSKADQDDIRGAIRVLESAPKPTKRARQHHLRTAYALADLYERAGEVPRARELFQRVAASDPDFADVSVRLRALD